MRPRSDLEDAFARLGLFWASCELASMDTSPEAETYSQNASERRAIGPVDIGRPLRRKPIHKTKHSLATGIAATSPRCVSAAASGRALP